MNNLENYKKNLLKQTNITLKCCSLLFNMFQNVFWNILEMPHSLKICRICHYHVIHGRWKWPLHHTASFCKRKKYESFANCTCIFREFLWSHTWNQDESGTIRHTWCDSPLYPADGTAAASSSMLQYAQTSPLMDIDGTTAHDEFTMVPS